MWDRRRETGDVRQETWDRRRETGDVRQTWDRRREIGDVTQDMWDRGHENWDVTRDVRKKMCDRRQELSTLSNIVMGENCLKYTAQWCNFWSREFFPLKSGTRRCGANFKKVVRSQHWQLESLLAHFPLSWGQSRYDFTGRECRDRVSPLQMSQKCFS